MFARDQIFKQLLNAHSSPHLADLVEAAIDHHSHGFVKDEAEAKFVLLGGEAVL